MDDGTFVSLSLGNYKGAEENLKNILVKRTLIKRQEKLSFTYRFKTRDLFKNHDIPEGLTLLQGQLHSGFRVANLVSTHTNTTFEVLNNGKHTYREKANTDASAVSMVDLNHDRAKKRLIEPAEKPYLYDLKITDDKGAVFKNAQDKYRQINHFVEILSPLIKDTNRDAKLRVVDMGSGKGYLTFALYDYLTTVRNIDAEITGVEFRPDLVELCNHIATRSGFSQLHFEQGTIEDYESGNTDILIALHACDTATDDAIFKGIHGQAELIVVAPCCHKQIRRQMEASRVHNEIDFLTRHGIFLERQAEMVTDGIRALIMEYFGYKTRVFEFISGSHTPKNVMIVGQKLSKGATEDPAILAKIRSIKSYFGIESHHLEKMMGI
jgi:SAM-dependent methyltransferase